MFISKPSFLSPHRYNVYLRSKSTSDPVWFYCCYCYCRKLLFACLSAKKLLFLSMCCQQDNIPLPPVLPESYNSLAYVARNLLFPAWIATKLLSLSLCWQQVNILVHLLPPSYFSPACVASKFIFLCLCCQQVTFPQLLLPASNFSPDCVALK